ncbi:hypothetical protein THAOC_02921, partial [Thalassiosira oceanica]
STFARAADHHREARRMTYDGPRTRVARLKSRYEPLSTPPAHAPHLPDRELSPHLRKLLVMEPRVFIISHGRHCVYGTGASFGGGGRHVQNTHPHDRSLCGKSASRWTGTKTKATPNADDLVGRTRADEQTEQRDAWSSSFPSSDEASGNKATSWGTASASRARPPSRRRAREAGSVSKARRSGGGPPRAQPAPSHLARADRDDGRRDLRPLPATEQPARARPSSAADGLPATRRRPPTGRLSGSDSPLAALTATTTAPRTSRPCPASLQGVLPPRPSRPDHERVARDGRGVRGGERRERERGGGLGCAPRALAAQRRFGSGDNFELVEVDGDGLGDDGPSRLLSQLDIGLRAEPIPLLQLKTYISFPKRRSGRSSRACRVSHSSDRAAVARSRHLAQVPFERRPDDGGLALAASAAVISPGKTRAAAGEDDIRPSSTGLAPAASPPAVAVAPRRPGLVPLERLSSWPPAASNLGPVLRAAPTAYLRLLPHPLRRLLSYYLPVDLGLWVAGGPNGPLLSANKVGHVWTSKRVAFCEPDQNWSLKLVFAYLVFT